MPMMTKSKSRTSPYVLLGLGRIGRIGLGLGVVMLWVLGPGSFLNVAGAQTEKSPPAKTKSAKAKSADAKTAKANDKADAAKSDWFEEHDRDHNKKITASEYHGNPMAFQQSDTNKDHALTRDEIEKYKTKQKAISETRQKAMVAAQKAKTQAQAQAKAQAGKNMARSNSYSNMRPTSMKSLARRLYSSILRGNR